MDQVSANIKQKVDIKQEVDLAKSKIDRVKAEVSKIVLGQDDIIDKMIVALISKGNVLVEGNPGLAKTLLVLTFSQVVNASFSRIQFTPDLLPTDIVGTNVFKGATSVRGPDESSFEVFKGPIFASFILADEVNRAPPKVQSAMLEAMQEKKVTIGKETLDLPEPFFVFATQNPIEQAGTYTLPAAQLDRFLFKIKITYPDLESEKKILDRNITLCDISEFKIQQIISSDEILAMHELAKEVYMDDSVKQYIIDIIEATRRPDKYNLEVGKYIDFGSSPRGSIGLYIASKAYALVQGSTFVTPDFVKSVAFDVLRHRIAINYAGQAENIDSDKIIKEILDKIPLG